MKIALFSDCYLDITGGVVSAMNAQKHALEAAGHEIRLFSTGFSKTEEELKALSKQNIYVVPTCKLFFRGLLPVSRRPKIVERWLLKEHPEIKDYDVFYIHHEGGCSIAGINLAKELKIPAIQMMHGREDVGETGIMPFGLRTIVAVLLNWFHSWYVPHTIKIHRDNYLATNLARAKMWELMVNHANYPDLVLSPSEHFRKKLIHYGVKKTIKVLPNSVADNKFPKSLKPKNLKKDEPIRIIWHSRVSAEKRIMPFLEALTKVNSKYHLDIYGDGVDLPRAKLYVKNHHINATFHGNVPFDSFSKALLNSHLDVQVAYNCDTFGMTLIEAEAYGVPVLFCDPDMKEIVPEGGYVLTTSPEPSSIASAIDDLANYPEKIEQMSKVMIKHRNEVSASNRFKILDKILKEITH